MLRLAHKAGLLLICPAAVFWIPLVSDNRFGNLTILDLVYAALWVTTVLQFLNQQISFRSAQPQIELAVLGLVSTVGITLGSISYGATDYFLEDALKHMKAFGFACILPLSIKVCKERRMHLGVAAVIAGSASLSVVLPYTGLHAYMPMFQHNTDLLWQQAYRPIGIIGNPNSFAYQSLLAGLAVLWLYTQTKRSQLAARLLLILVGGTLLWGVLSSGSRSAFIAMLACASYAFFSGKATATTRVIAISIIAISFYVGLTVSEVFDERITKALAETSQEANVASRIEAQTLALQTWAEWPLGVGSSNMALATSGHSRTATYVLHVRGADSVYVDFLLAGGLISVLSLLRAFVLCWTMGNKSQTTSKRITRLTVVSVATMGFASAAPASVYVAPLFFTIAALGGSRATCKETHERRGR